MTKIAQRKEDHLDLAARGDVSFRHKTTLLSCVDIVHYALPELHYDAVDLSVTLLGKKLAAPIVIAAMTGGTPRAGTINRQLAEIAQARGYGFGLGSQRAMRADPGKQLSYAVRDAAPSTLVLGNIGGVQAAQYSTAQLADLCGSVGADALCIHLNPAMELVQAEGDRDFRGVEAVLQRLVEELPYPVVAKETGCGISGSVADRLHAIGIRHLDVSGAGGTSWVGVEAERARAGDKALGEAFRDWGIPTAASLLQVRPERFESVIATGGVGDGLEAAKAIALGASAVGIARPVLQALDQGGPEQALQYLELVERQLRVACLLVGAGSVQDLKRAARIVSPPLSQWAP